jgi:hypothetical protein
MEPYRTFLDSFHSPINAVDTLQSCIDLGFCSAYMALYGLSAEMPFGERSLRLLIS